MQALIWSPPVAHSQCCSQFKAALLQVGGDLVSHHSRLRDICNDFYHRACRVPQLEMSGWSRQHTRPGNVLVPNWVLRKPAAFDLSVTLTLNTQVFHKVSVTVGLSCSDSQAWTE